MATGDVLKLAVIGRDEYGKELVNVFHYRQEDITIGETPGAALVAQWQDNVLESFIRIFGEDIFLTGYQVRGITDPTYGEDFLEDPEREGMLAGGLLPTQNAPTITWLTGLIGRSFRGRTFTWPVPKAYVDGNFINGDLRDALVAFVGQAIDIPTNILPPRPAFKLGVLSRYADGDLRAEPLFTPVTAGRVNLPLRVMRKRQTDVGS